LKRAGRPLEPPGSFVFGDNSLANPVAGYENQGTFFLMNLA
jgi:hypothetical protein